VSLAGRLRKESIVSLKWIVQRLSMGSWSYVSSLLANKKSAKSDG